jgi:hypothetical protein
MRGYGKPQIHGNKAEANVMMSMDGASRPYKFAAFDTIVGSAFTLWSHCVTLSVYSFLPCTPTQLKVTKCLDTNIQL